MSKFLRLSRALDERTIAKIGITFDIEREKYIPSSPTPRDFNAFITENGRFYNQIYSKCVSRGGRLSTTEAYIRSKEIIERNHQRQGGNIVTAFNNACDNGYRNTFDIITDSLKGVQIERYIEGVLDSYVAPNSWEEKVEIIRQFIAHCGPHLSRSLVKEQPARYANDFKLLIRSYIMALRDTSSILRRL